MFAPKSFQDARSLLEHGVQSLRPGEMVHLPHFNLMDAMNAIEIMDPRMDSGVSLSDGPGTTPFDPQAPLLPEEVCWILDRAMACEMAYQTGLTLSQTVYTCLYTLPGNFTLIIPEVLQEVPAFLGQSEDERKQRPLELVGLALRAGLMATTKSTGLVWDELMRGNLYDGEDFMGDKFGLSLCDQEDPMEILAQLEDAIDWLRGTDVVEEKWQDALLARLTFRSALLRSLLEICNPSSPIRPTSVALLPSLLSSLLIKPSDSPSIDSTALAAFDPAVNRSLVSHVPLSTIDLGDNWRKEAVERMTALVDGLEEVAESIWDNGMGGGWRNIVGWLDYFHLLGITTSRPQAPAFIRSIFLSVFYQPEENTIFNASKLGHLSSMYFSEVAGVPEGVLRELIELSEEDRPLRVEGWDGRSLSEALNIFCQRVDGFLVNSAMNLGQNRARSKRLAGKGTLQWEELFQEASSLVPLCQERLRLARYPEEIIATFDNLPVALELHRLLLIQHSLLTGFNLELYSKEDWAMIWWAAGKTFTEEARLWARLTVSMTTEEKRELNRRRVQTAAGWAVVSSIKLKAAVDLPEATLAEQQARFASRFKHLLPLPSKFARSRLVLSKDMFAPIWTDYVRDVELLQGGDQSVTEESSMRCIAELEEEHPSTLEELLPGAPRAYLALCRDLEEQISRSLQSENPSPAGYGRNH